MSPYCKMWVSTLSLNFQAFLCVCNRNFFYICGLNLFFLNVDVESYQGVELSWKFLNVKYGVDFMLFQKTFIDVLQLAFESPPPIMSVMSNTTNVKYEGLKYGKFMVNEIVEWLSITFSMLMQIEVHLTIGQLLVLHMRNCQKLQFFVYFAIASRG